MRSAEVPHVQGMDSLSAPMQDYRFLAIMAQKMLLASQLIVLHWLSISQWTKLDSPTLSVVSLNDNPALLCFYMLYMLFLALTSLQLKYQIHMTRGGLGFTHSTDI